MPFLTNPAYEAEVAHRLLHRKNHPLEFLLALGIMLICTVFPAVSVAALDDLSTNRQAPLTLPKTLTLSEASAAALLGSPVLESFNYALRAAEARRIQAGLRPNPALRAEFENLAGTGDLSGTRGLETTLLLSQLLELGGKRAQRAATAAMRLNLLEADYEILRLDVLAEVARRFVNVVNDQALLEVVRAAVAIAERTLDAVESRVAAARATGAELSRAQIALARARIDLAQRESELRISRRALAATWGDLTPRFARVEADLFALPALGGFKQLRAQLRASPDLQRFLTERRLREAELQLAKSGAIPNASIGAGLRRLEAVDDQALMLSFSVGLPVFDRNQGNVAAAMERLQRVESDRRVRLIAAQTLLFATYQELLQARNQASTLEQEVIPEAQQALNEIEAGYRAGRFSFLELAAAQREFIDVRNQAIVAAADFHQLLIEIERLTGMGFARPKKREVAP